MKKLMLLSLAIPVALLFSFALRQDGIKKIGTDLYSISSSSSKTMSVEDQAKIKKLITEHYKLKNTTEDIVIGPDNAINAKGNWIFSTNAFSNFISSKFITWDDKAKLDTDGGKAKEIITKYARK
jgi:hypothetical protein